MADRKTIVCPHAGCTKAFTRRANLNVHIRAVHEGLRFVCGDDAADMASMTTAEGGAGSVVDRKPFNGWTDPDLIAWEARGEGCGRGFVSKMKLEEHIRYVHLRHDRPVPVSVNVLDVGLDTEQQPASLLPGMADIAVTNDALATPSADMLIDALLGTNRTLGCTLPGCAARFVRQHDLNLHLQKDHPVTAVDNDDKFFNPEEFWIGGGDHMDDDDVEPDGAVDSNLLVSDDMFGAYMDMENINMGMPANNDGRSGSMLPPQILVNTDPQWQMEEAEMRQLIGSDNVNDNGSGVGVLDPNLFL